MFTPEQIVVAKVFFKGMADFLDEIESAAESRKRTTKKKVAASSPRGLPPMTSTSSTSEDLPESLRARLKTVNVDGETFYVAEGDLLLDEDEVTVYALERRSLKMQAMIGTVDLTNRSGELLGIRTDGKLIRWEPGLTLTYCVLRKSFLRQEDYNLVRENMRRATADWENTCGVKFEHKAELDDSPISPNPDGVLFAVRHLDAQGRFIASAFFPTDPPARRRVLIDPSYFTTSFDKVGVLRHELGHVLGFRHEHIRSGAPSDCPDESTADTFDFTQYDPKSVMHYFCGGVGSRELSISELDMVGSQKLYGPPFNALSYVAA